MKKDNLKYALFAVVFLIWGGVIYMYFFYEKEAPSPLVSPSTGPLPVTVVASPRDTFSLMLDYRDPFLGSVGKQSKPKPKQLPNSYSPPSVPKKRPSKVKQKKNPLQDKEEAQDVDWSRVIYFGKAGQSGNEEQFVLLKIDGVLHTATEGGQYSGFEVLEITAGGVKVRYGESEKWIGQ